MSLPIHLYVYWDYSNIFIEAQYIAQATEKQYGEDVGYRVRLDFKNLMQLLERTGKSSRQWRLGLSPLK
ncbi:MAG: hypothetical protein ETSY2_54375 [Candidatus Entotheonella gemina]|uniref:NYN domain-containing protein n=1 Tax=Candidatus Entotheonella gemina TaxID=1429439 RepID=W4L284_9BACT|nr:MAG: hypothetical protein ETSY2_54375 [Candidatus Entotheonella gemina]